MTMRLDDSDMRIEEVDPADPDPSADGRAPMMPLSEFIECFTPPQCGRIADGHPADFDTYAAFDIPRGCSLTFNRKVSPSVTLSFQDAWGGASTDRWLSVTLATDYPGRFELLTYDPASGDTRPDHIFRTVADLARSFPLCVQANASYDNRMLDAGGAAFSCGDRLKLSRLVYKDGEKYLECRKADDPRLMLLPMDCVGDFTAVADRNAYLLSDIVCFVPRRRRVKLVSDTSRPPYKISGLPDAYSGELYVEEPEAFIEATPVTDSGLIIGLPGDLSLMVYPDEASQGQLFSSFVNANRNLFPVMTRVADWRQETSILENHRVRPGVQIVIHGWTRQSKVLAVGGGRHFAIPLTYTGRFRIKPRRYEGVTELERAHPGNKLRVVSVDPGDGDLPLERGDVIRIKRDETPKRRTLREVEIKCEKYEPAGGRARDIKLPLGSPAVFEEIIDEGRGAELGMKELVSFIGDGLGDLEVEVTERSADQKVSERDLDVGATVTLSHFVIEPAVYVSVDSADAPAFHIPLRTLIYVAFVYQLDKSASPLLAKTSPRLSTLDRCVETLAPDVYAVLCPHAALDTTESYGRTTAVQKPTQSWVADGSSPTNAWPGGLGASRNFDLLSGKARKAPSVAESDAELTKSKGLTKLKNRFRRHRSQENIFRSNSPANVSRDFAPLSVTAPSVEYTRSSVNGSLASGSSVDVSGEGSQSLSSASTSRSLTSSATPVNISAVNSISPTEVNVVNSHPKVNSASKVKDVNGVNGVNGMHAQNSVNSISSDGGSSLPSPQPVQVPPGYALIQSQSVTDSSGNGSLCGSPKLPEGSPEYILVPILSPKMLDGIQELYRNLRLSSVEDEDDEENDYDSGAQDMSLKRTKLKFSLPRDGNLYHFSVKKMATFLRQLRVDDDVIAACVKQKLDGKKFSRLGEDDLSKLGILHPVVVHFRRLTVKTKPKFML